MANQQEQQEIQTLSQVKIQSLDEENLESVTGSGWTSNLFSCFKKPKVEGEASTASIRSSNTAGPSSTVPAGTQGELAPRHISPLASPLASPPVSPPALPDRSTAVKIVAWESPLR